MPRKTRARSCSQASSAASLSNKSERASHREAHARSGRPATGAKVDRRLPERREDAKTCSAWPVSPIPTGQRPPFARPRVSAAKQAECPKCADSRGPLTATGARSVALTRRASGVLLVLFRAENLALQKLDEGHLALDQLPPRGDRRAAGRAVVRRSPCLPYSSTAPHGVFVGSPRSRGRAGHHRRVAPEASDGRTLSSHSAD